MSPRRPDRLRPASVLSHLGVMVAVATVMGLLVAGLALPFAAVTGLSAKTVADGMEKLPEDLTAAPLAQRTRILGKDGKTLATLYDQNRVNVRLADVAPIMRKAIISIEDYRFYQHGALDLRGTMRAFVTNQANSGVTQGGSSVTQQMVKMTLVNQAKTRAERLAAIDDTYQRKLKELRYAIAFEEKYSKDWILQRYLNIAYFGDGAYGIEAAARHYFSTTADKLTLRQAALLAGLVKNPTGYDPTDYPSRAKERRDTVLARMAELQVITGPQARKNQAAPLGLKLKAVRNGCVRSKAPFFCDYAVQYLLADKNLGRTVEDRRRLLLGGGLTIKTTLDLRFQRAADRSVSNRVRARDQAIGGLAMVEPGSGKVRALAQSRPMGSKVKKGETYLNYVVPQEYGDSNGFQAGSTFKAFVLASAISQDIPLSTRISSPDTISIPVNRFRDCDGYVQGSNSWNPKNSTGSGSFDLYTGTRQSVNTFFAQLELRTGLCKPAKLAKAMGVNVDTEEIYPPFTLGVNDTNPLTMAGAYATFAARGEYCEPRPVTAVLNAAGRTLEKYPNKCTQLLRRDVADAVNDVLRGVQEGTGFGASAGLALEQESAGKTGTTNSNRAVWFVGYTPNMAAAAMIAGANRKGQWLELTGLSVGGTTVYNAAGSTLAGPMWGDAMKEVQGILPNKTFVQPNPRTIEGQLIPVPSLYGYSIGSAESALRSAGFEPVVGPTVDSGNPAGTVAFLSPSSGSSASSGSTVTIYVSDGTPYQPPPPKKKKKKNKPRNRDRGGQNAAAPAQPQAPASPGQTAAANGDSQPN